MAGTENTKLAPPLTEDQIKKLHVILTLTGDEVGFDNPLTNMREWWKKGALYKTAPQSNDRDFLWMTEPNPWQRLAVGILIPYVFE